MQRLNSLEIPKLDLSGLVGSLTGVSGGMPGFAGAALAPALAGAPKSGFTIVLGGEHFEAQSESQYRDAPAALRQGRASAQRRKKAGLVNLKMRKLTLISGRQRVFGRALMAAASTGQSSTAGNGSG